MLMTREMHVVFQSRKTACLSILSPCFLNLQLTRGALYSPDKISFVIFLQQAGYHVLQPGYHLQTLWK